MTGRHKGMYWTKADFEQAAEDEIVVSLDKWFPTSEMLWGYVSWVLWVPLRVAVGWYPVKFPGGLTRTAQGSWGLRDAPLDDAFLDRWSRASENIPDPSGTNDFEPSTFRERLLPAIYICDKSQVDSAPIRVDSAAIRVDSSEAGRTIFYSLIYSSESGGIFSHREIRIADGHAYHHVLYADIITGDKFASKLFGAAVGFYLGIGIREIRLTAGFNMGGLLWPKYGFKPVDKDEWQSIHQKICRNFNALPDSIKPRIERTLDGILADENPIAIWRIAALNEHTFPVRGENRGAGDRLLYRTRWKGVLDFDSPYAMKILKERLELHGIKLENAP